MVKSQASLRSLHQLGADIIDWVVRIIGWQEDSMFKNLASVPDVPFLIFVKFTMADFLLNCMKPQIYNHNDERPVYCEIFIPMFKALGSTIGKLNYVW